MVGANNCTVYFHYHDCDIRNGHSISLDIGFFHMIGNIDLKFWAIHNFRRNSLRPVSNIYMERNLKNHKILPQYSNRESRSLAHFIPIFKKGELMRSVIGLTQYKTFGGYNGSARYSFEFNIVNFKTRKILKKLHSRYSGRYYTDNYLGYGQNSGDMMRKKQMIRDRVEFRLDLTNNGGLLMKMFERKRVNFANFNIFKEGYHQMKFIYIDSFTTFGNDNEIQILRNISFKKHVKSISSYDDLTAMYIKKKKKKHGIYVMKNNDTGDYGDIIFKIEKGKIDKSKFLFLNFIEKNILLLCFVDSLYVVNVLTKKKLKYDLDLMQNFYESELSDDFLNQYKPLVNFSREKKKISFVLGQKYEGVILLDCIYRDIEVAGLNKIES